MSCKAAEMEMFAVPIRHAPEHIRACIGDMEVDIHVF